MMHVKKNNLNDWPWRSDLVPLVKHWRQVVQSLGQNNFNQIWGRYHRNNLYKKNVQGEPNE